jgi:hypothetical protein
MRKIRMFIDHFVGLPWAELPEALPEAVLELWGRIQTFEKTFASRSESQWVSAKRQG